MAGLSAAFGFLATLLAMIGIYGVTSWSVAQRTQEIGVRIAMGATMRNILLLIMKRGLWQIAAGLALGLAAALPAMKVIATLPLGASPHDPSVLLAVSAALASVGTFACWLPARRAASLDPVKAIRYE